MTLHLIALGANSGGSLAANAGAIRRAISRLPGRVRKVSRLYRTPAWPDPSEPDFVNAAAALWCPLPPERLLSALHRIEALHGRVRERRWGPRVLDLDLLASGRQVRPGIGAQRAWMEMPRTVQANRAPDGVVLPHPRLTERAFVLLPLADVAPRWRHPVTGRTVQAMADGLPAGLRRQIRPIGTPPGVVNPEVRA